MRRGETRRARQDTRGEKRRERWREFAIGEERHAPRATSATLYARVFLLVLHVVCFTYLWHGDGFSALAKHRRTTRSARSVAAAFTRIFLEPHRMEQLEAIFSSPMISRDLFLFPLSLFSSRVSLSLSYFFLLFSFLFRLSPPPLLFLSSSSSVFFLFFFFFLGLPLSFTKFRKNGCVCARARSESFFYFLFFFLIEYFAIKYIHIYIYTKFMYSVYASCPLFLDKNIPFSSPCSLLRPFSFPLSLTLFHPPFSRLSSFFYLVLHSLLFILCDIIDNRDLRLR